MRPVVHSYFAAAFATGSLWSTALFMAARHHRIIRNRRILRTIVAHTKSWAILLAILSQFDLILIAWSVRYIDISATAVLWETWPVIMIILMIFLFRDERRYANTTVANMLLTILAFVGLAFVVSSQTNLASAASSEARSLASALIGSAIVLAAAVLFALEAFMFRWGADLSGALIAHPGLRQADRTSLELFGVMLGRSIAIIVAAPLIMVSGMLFAGESLTLQLVVPGIAAGALIGTAGNLAWRQANLLTSNVAINAMSYANPVIALVWLGIFSRINITEVDYLIIGTAVIVVSNLLINFQAEIRIGFRSFIIALWACGTFVYFRGDVAELFARDDWSWPAGEYFTAVGLAATVLTLILSFRAARLVARANDETNRAFALFSRVDLLVERGIIGGDVRGLVLRIDAPENPQDLAGAYRSARQRIRHAYATSSDDPVRQELAEVVVEMDALAHSRQEGQDFGEYMALVVFAVITVALLLLSLDENAAGWNGFLTEMFTILFSAVIIFLVVNVWDLQRERNAPVLQRAADGGGYGVVFRDAVARRSEQIVSVVVVLAMTGAFTWLIWQKWLE